uniref:Uncharacterized protein n=1 Tax=Candidatus Kentrum sp. MB TaxID=2138164 RepID=A0A450XP72_9GAMM|nr:MAG: hypothetical protein BECKMB1821G_GA0114241_10782 [Candidatus Kentron sp. MB]VFK34627.1 MAG: hypothetical protein BECKMB1821I_GA0114274_10782 [Candidatus Kentron sp. MB]VFK76832.1 MAG: hypothetical protein BECKMB1821H_GA0114242_10782 [Candidatus Kentron sp. MB]
MGIRFAYGDLNLIPFSDRRQRWKDPGPDNARMRDGTGEELRQLAPVRKKLAQAATKLTGYRETLARVHGGKLRLCTHAVVCIGLARLAWSSSQGEQDPPQGEENP